MIFIHLFLAIVFTAFPVNAAELRGKLYMIGPADELQPVINTTIRIEETDDSDVTTDTGKFRLFMPDAFKPGETVTLKVDKSGYEILRPFGGKARIPADPLKGPVIVHLDELRSHRFLSNKAFALLVEDIAYKAKNEVKADDSKQEIDLDIYLKDWAVKYGFGLDDVRAEMDRWAAEVETKQEDFYELGLAAFYKKNYGEAAQKFEQSAITIAQKREKLQRQDRELKEKEIQAYRLAGDSYYNDYRFKEALKAYQEALSEVDKEAAPRTWALLTTDISNTYQSLGIRAEGKPAKQYLALSVENYQQLFQIYTRDTLPQQWAGTQNNLGLALWNQGIRTGGAAGAELLAQAVSAYRKALTVYTRDTLPQQWAMTQNNLGLALKEMGLLTPDNERKKQLLGQALESFLDALDIRTYEYLPYDWAQTQNNLADTYVHMQNWPNAAECFVNVLKVYPALEIAFTQADFIYHECLFEFEKAYKLNFNWVKKLGNDGISDVSNFIEKNLTTARFTDAQKLLAGVFAEIKPDHQVFIPLRAIEIATLLALKKSDAVSAKLNILIEALQLQAENYTCGWTFNGTKHFINESDDLAYCRNWLLSLLSAIEGENREDILKKLRKVKEDFGNVTNF